MIKSVYSKTHDFRSKIVANKLGLSENMVARVISEYLNTLEEDLMNGERVTIRGVVSVTPVETSEGISLRARTSSAIIDKVKEIDNYEVKFFDEAIVEE